MSQPNNRYLRGDVWKTDLADFERVLVVLDEPDAVLVKPIFSRRISNNDTYIDYTARLTLDIIENKNLYISENLWFRLEKTHFIEKIGGLPVYLVSLHRHEGGVLINDSEYNALQRSAAAYHVPRPLDDSSVTSDFWVEKLRAFLIPKRPSFAFSMLFLILLLVSAILYLSGLIGDHADDFDKHAQAGKTDPNDQGQSEDTQQEDYLDEKLLAGIVFDGEYADKEKIANALAFSVSSDENIRDFPSLGEKIKTLGLNSYVRLENEIEKIAENSTPLAHLTIQPNAPTTIRTKVTKPISHSIGDKETSRAYISIPTNAFNKLVDNNSNGAVKGLADEAEVVLAGQMTDFKKDEKTSLYAFQYDIDRLMCPNNNELAKLSLKVTAYVANKEIERWINPDSGEVSFLASKAIVAIMPTLSSDAKIRTIYPKKSRDLTGVIPNDAYIINMYPLHVPNKEDIVINTLGAAIGVTQIHYDYRKSSVNDQNVLSFGIDGNKDQSYCDGKSKSYIFCTNKDHSNGSTPYYKDVLGNIHVFNDEDDQGDLVAIFPQRTYKEEKSSFVLTDYYFFAIFDRSIFVYDEHQMPTNDGILFGDYGVNDAFYIEPGLIYIIQNDSIYLIGSISDKHAWKKSVERATISISEPGNTFQKYKIKKSSLLSSYKVSRVSHLYIMDELTDNETKKSDRILFKLKFNYNPFGVVEENKFLVSFPNDIVPRDITAEAVDGKMLILGSDRWLYEIDLDQLQ